MLRIDGKNWKTNSTGVVMIIAAIVGVYFKSKNGGLDEGTIIAAVTSILGGIGLLLAKDKDVTNTTP